MWKKNTIRRVQDKATMDTLDRRRRRKSSWESLSRSYDHHDPAIDTWRSILDTILSDRWTRNSTNGSSLFKDTGDGLQRLRSKSCSDISQGARRDSTSALCPGSSWGSNLRLSRTYLGGKENLEGRQSSLLSFPNSTSTPRLRRRSQYPKFASPTAPLSKSWEPYTRTSPSLKPLEKWIASSPSMIDVYPRRSRLKRFSSQDDISRSFYVPLNDVEYEYLPESKPRRAGSLSPSLLHNRRSNWPDPAESHRKPSSGSHRVNRQLSYLNSYLKDCQPCKRSRRRRDNAMLSSLENSCYHSKSYFIPDTDTGYECHGTDSLQDVRKRDHKHVSWRLDPLDGIECRCCAKVISLKNLVLYLP